MSVSTQTISGVLHINALGSFHSLEEQTHLIELLNNPPTINTLEVNFYDARVLSSNIIAAMHQLANIPIKLKFNVFHVSLVHTLIQLGFQVRYKNEHSLTKSNPTSPPKAIVIGGSAESLDKIITLIKAFPRTETSFFIIQHVSDKYPNNLDQLLKQHTDYHIILAQNLLPIETGTIYIAPSNYHLKVGARQVYLTQDKEINFARPSIDALFKSIAFEYGSSALAILLCGYGQDGVEGTKYLKQQGTTVFIEDASECAQASQLPSKAKLAGHYHYCMGIQQIACHVASLISQTQTLTSQVLNYFLAAINTVYDYDFTGYQHGTLLRRTNSLMHKLNFTDFFSFQQAVLTDPELFEQFFLEISINVTEFFRYPEQFRLLREDIFPYLNAFPHIKIWSAGCSTGEEAYSLAILLDEMGMLDKTQIFATDINHIVLHQAQSQLYPLASLEKNQKNYLAAGGVNKFDDAIESNGRYLRIHDKYKKKILFHHHSLIQDGIFNEFQLILCRNVLIYICPEQQLKIAQKLFQSLHSDGFLILAQNEGVMIADNSPYFHSYLPKQHIYRPQ